MYLICFGWKEAHVGLFIVGDDDDDVWRGLGVGVSMMNDLIKYGCG